MSKREDFENLLDKGAMEYSICDIQEIKGFAHSFQIQIEEKDKEIERLNNIINETMEEIDNWKNLLETGLRKNSKKICISTAKNMLFFIKLKLEGEKNDK